MAAEQKQPQNTRKGGRKESTVQGTGFTQETTEKYRRNDEDWQNEKTENVREEGGTKNRGAHEPRHIALRTHYSALQNLCCIFNLIQFLSLFSCTYYVCIYIYQNFNRNTWIFLFQMSKNCILIKMEPKCQSCNSEQFFWQGSLALNDWNKCNSEQDHSFGLRWSKCSNKGRSENWPTSWAVAILSPGFWLSSKHVPKAENLKCT